MEVRNTVFSIVFLVTFFATALCGKGEVECNHYLVNVYVRGANCLELGATPETDRELRRAKTTEDLRRFFRGYCQRQSIVRECLSNATNLFEVCKNETYFNTFGMLRDLLVTILDIECARGGTGLPILWRQINALGSNQTEHDKLSPCLYRSYKVIEETVNSDIDPASKVFISHKELQWFKECVSEIDFNQEFKDFVDVISAEFLKRMKCINPEDGTVQLCDTIDASLIEFKSACSFKTRNDQLPIYDVLENDAGRCLDFVIDNDKPPSSDEIAKETFTGCNNNHGRYHLMNCLDFTKIFSNMCMDVTAQQELLLSKDWMGNSFEVSCTEGYPRFSRVMTEVKRLTDLAYDHPILVCIAVAKSTRNVTDVHRSSSKNMRFYHEVETFKGCLVNKLYRDPISVEAATSLINDLLKMMKCVHPQKGTTVLCETLH